MDKDVNCNYNGYYGYSIRYIVKVLIDRQEHD